jgi:hypothetical protein
MNLPTIKLTIHPEPVKCFFNLGEPIWYPGWTIASTDLPFSTFASLFLLLWDAAGELHWVSSRKVKYEGHAHEFEHYYYQHKFDWNKWRKFPPIDWSNPVKTPKKNKPILKAFRCGKNDYF